MANVLSVVWIVIAYAVMNTSLLVWASLMLPNPVERARRRVEQRPVASFFLGILFWGATLLIAGTLVSQGKHGLLQLIGWTLAAPMLAGSIIGGAAFAQILAGRMQSRMKSESPLLALVGGALATTLPVLLPVIGWFVYLPVVGFISIGAGVLGLLSKREIAGEPQRRPQPAAAPGHASANPYANPQPAYTEAPAPPMAPAFAEARPGAPASAAAASQPGFVLPASATAPAPWERESTDSRPDSRPLPTT